MAIAPQETYTQRLLGGFSSGRLRGLRLLAAVPMTPTEAGLLGRCHLDCIRRPCRFDVSVPVAYRGADDRDPKRALGRVTSQSPFESSEFMIIGLPRRVHHCRVYQSLDHRFVRGQLQLPKHASFSRVAGQGPIGTVVSDASGGDASRDRCDEQSERRNTSTCRWLPQ